MSENNLSRFERATVVFAPGLEVDGYQTPSGEYRIGVTGASKLLGFSKEWLGRVATRKGDTLKALEGMGFSGLPLEGKISKGTGYQKISTISTKDFSLLIIYAVKLGKKEAMQLQAAMNEVTVDDFILDAFGERQLTMEEKRGSFTEKYSHTIAWLEEENADRRADWQLIEQQENFTGLDQYRPQPDDD